MSTVVDNDKYIINGSTLSDIGDSLRDFYGETVQVNETVVVYQKSMSCSAYSTSTTETFNFNYIFGSSGAGFNRYGIEDTGYMRLQISGNGYTISVTPVKENVYAFPFTITLNGRYATAQIYCYPVDENLDYIIYDQTIHKPSTQYNSYNRNITVTKPNTFLVEDIATSITELGNLLSGTNFVAISPFTLSYLESNSTDISAYISDIDDIVDFYLPADTYNGFWFRIKPIQSEKTTLTSGAGNGKISYPVKQYSYGSYNTPAANWESSAGNSGMRVFFSNGKLVVTGSYSYTNYYMPAFLVYK